ncbi:MAG TPA: glycosyltransferase family 2 protein [Methylomirabilota bacterium]|nr:glycosyltransferase family 2 protein [Methylomirabilota bacterium]
MVRRHAAPDDDLPLVSVVTPSLNQGAFVEDAIESVWGQDYRPLEHVVVDGGSTDATRDILHAHDHLVWRSEPDHGQSDALNRGFRLARGEILGWLNADDAYLPGAVRAAVDHFRWSPEVDAVYGDCHVVDERRRLLHVIRPGPLALRRLLTFDQSLPQPTMFFRRRVLDRVGGVDRALDLAMDVDFAFRLARKARCAYVPGIRAMYRLHPATKSSVHGSRVLPEILLILIRTFTDRSLTPALASRRREAVAAAYISDGIRAFHAGDRVRARQQLMAGLSRYPQPFRMRTVKALLLLGDCVLGTRVTPCLRALVHQWSRRAPLAGPGVRPPASGPGPAAGATRPDPAGTRGGTSPGSPRGRSCRSRS